MRAVAALLTIPESGELTYLLPQLCACCPYITPHNFIVFLPDFVIPSLPHFLSHHLSTPPSTPSSPLLSLPSKDTNQAKFVADQVKYRHSTTLMPLLSSLVPWQPRVA